VPTSPVGVPLGTNKSTSNVDFSSQCRIICKVSCSPQYKSFAANNIRYGANSYKSQYPSPVGVSLGTNKKTSNIDLPSEYPIINKVDCSQLKRTGHRQLLQGIALVLVVLSIIFCLKCLCF
jgi:hypothetical protein